MKYEAVNRNELLKRGDLFINRDKTKVCIVVDNRSINLVEGKITVSYSIFQQNKRSPIIEPRIYRKC